MKQVWTCSTRAFSCVVSVVKGAINDLHGLPPVRAEEEMNHMIFRLRLAAEVSIDHLPDGRRPVCFPSQASQSVYSHLTCHDVPSIQGGVQPRLQSRREFCHAMGISICLGVGRRCITDGLTGEPHVHDIPPALDAPLLQQLGLGRLARAV